MTTQRTAETMQRPGGCAVLFEACPRCEVGDLAIRQVGDECLAHCLRCGFKGELASVYPLAHGDTAKLPKSASS